MTKKDTVAYSKILIWFIEPLLDGNEDEDELLMKAQAGMIAWNFSVSDANKLPHDAKFKEILKNITSVYPDAKETLNKLAVRKAMLFSEYNQFIFKVEMRTKPDGTKKLYVESAPVDKMKKE